VHPNPSTGRKIVFGLKDSRARHRVINEHGDPLEDTWVGKLRFAAGLAVREEAPESTELLPAVAPATRTLPFKGAQTVALRVPAAPQRRSLWRPAPGPIPNPFQVHPFGKKWFSEWLGTFSHNARAWKYRVRAAEVRWDQIDAKVDAAIVRVRAKRVEFDANWGATETRLAKLAAQRPSERPTTEMTGLVRDLNAMLAGERVAA
jgi:hypothetical protein